MIAAAHRPSEPIRPDLFPAVAFASWLAVTGIWWALAFAPLPVPQAWLERARAVCFGTLPNGLPETWGWLLLVLGPLSMFGFLIAVWGPELLEIGRRMARRPSGAALLMVVTLSVMAGAGAVVGRVHAAQVLDAAPAAAMATEALPAGYPRGLAPAPELDLIDQRGERVALASLAGRPAVVTFAFGHCRTICPILVHTLRRSFESAPAERAPALVVVTIDPWRDTPGSLPGIAESWQLDRLAEAHLLSGEVAEVERVREAWNVPTARDPATGDITHPGLIFVVDREGRLAYQFLNPSPAWIVEALERIDALAESGRAPA